MTTDRAGAAKARKSLDIQDPPFWAAGAIATTIVMLIVLAFLSVDSMKSITAGGRQVPQYTVINNHIDYQYDWSARADKPVIGGPEPLFGKVVNAEEASALIKKGKLVIQSRACMDCHTFYGNGAYFAPDLTKSWLDPAWTEIWMAMTQRPTKEEAMVEFLMHPDKYPTWTRRMPNLNLTEEEAKAVVAYLKWTSAVDTNGFPANFGQTKIQR